MTDVAADAVRPAPAVDAARLDRALLAANIPTLVLVLHQLTGDRRWLDPPYAPKRGRGMDDNRTGGLPDEVQDAIRVATRDAVLAWAGDGGTPVAVPSPRGPDLVELLGVAMGEPVPEEFEAMMAELLGFAPAPRHGVVPGADRLEVVVIGAGVSGMTAAIRLRGTGAHVTVLEKNADVGGTWLENRYPGAGVDTPSYLYSVTFFERDWSTFFGRRDEVETYLRDLADAYDLRSLIRFGVEVESATWDDRAQRWTVVTTSGERLTANLVISAVGQLNRPRTPAIAGLADFEGEVFHSAQWPAGVSLDGRRVAVVGTGASAMQIVPAIVDEVRELVVYQRSPQWIAPNADIFSPVDDDVHWLMANVPFYRQWYRARLAWTFNDKVHPSLQVDPGWEHPHRSVNAVNDSHRRAFTRYLTEQLDGRPDLQRLALPDYPPFGKRMLLDNGWYAALRRDHVELVPEQVVAFDRTGVRGGAGTRREVDVVVMCTGFHSHRFLYPMTIVGREGISLEQHWGPDDATAHLGMTVPGFPNLFMLLGPNTALGHGGSVITVSEFQIEYVVALVERMVAGAITSVECRADVADDYTRRVDDAHAAMIWTHRGMTNWYRNAAGRVVSTLPWRIVDYREMVRTPELDDYVVRVSAPAEPSASR